MTDSQKKGPGRKNPAAVALGRLGGKKRKLTPEEAKAMQLRSAKRRQENRESSKKGNPVAVFLDTVYSQLRENQRLVNELVTVYSCSKCYTPLVANGIPLVTGHECQEEGPVTTSPLA